MRILVFLLLLSPILLNAQTNWNKDGNSYTTIEDNSIIEITLPAMTKTTLVSADQLAPRPPPTRNQTATAPEPVDAAQAAAPSRFVCRRRIDIGRRRRLRRVYRLRRGCRLVRVGGGRGGELIGGDQGGLVMAGRVISMMELSSMVV